MPEETYIWVDVEAAGPIPREYSMLSVGACVVENANRSFYAELKPINDKYLSATLKVTSFELDYLIEKGLEPKVAMIKMRDWFRDVSEGKRLVFVAFNAVFDWSFVNYYSHKYLGKNPFGIAGL